MLRAILISALVTLVLVGGFLGFEAFLTRVSVPEFVLGIPSWIIGIFAAIFVFVFVIVAPPILAKRDDRHSNTPD